MILIHRHVIRPTIRVDAKFSINLFRIWPKDMGLSKLLSNGLLIKIILLVFCVKYLKADCPRLCECKWKSGKESVICLNANLSSIPLYLDGGTQVLDLTGNNILKISHDELSAAGLVNLQKVYIAKCRVRTLERFAFRHLNNLVELDLSYNAIAAIPSHTFDSIPELRELKMSGNPLQKVINEAFIHIPQLVRLELSNCKISVVEPKAFAGLEHSLEWLHLDNNRITDIRSTSITSLQNLHGIELAGNPWNCSCMLRPLREWMQRNNVPYGIPPICRTPLRLASKPWDQLDLDEFACAPAIAAYIPNSQGIEGNNVTMTCRIGGVPEPNVRWLLKNKVIANLSSGAYSSGKKLYVLHLLNHDSNLTILTAELQDAGTYVCTAENKAGRAEASISLTVARRSTDSPLTSHLTITSTILCIIILILCVTLCVFTVHRRAKARRTSSQQNRVESYEKIEMNNKINNNCALLNNGTLPQSSVVSSGTRRGDYYGLPTNDVEEEDFAETSLDSGTGRRDKPKLNLRDDSNGTILNVQRWGSGEGNSFEADLHIPRRNSYMDNRDDCTKTQKSTSGTSKAQLLSPDCKINLKSLLEEKDETKLIHVASNGIPQVLHPHIMRKEILSESGGSLYTTIHREDTDPSFPDLLSTSKQLEDFCTLPRKKSTNTRVSFYNSGSAKCSNSTDSETPLLSDYSNDYRYLRKVPQRSNSFMNLSSDYLSNTSTPLLNINELGVGQASLFERSDMSNSLLLASLSSNANTYDYHAAQLERFLEEYRSLQAQLTKMKETCEGIQEQSSRTSSLPKSILKSKVVSSTAVSPSVLPSSSTANNDLTPTNRNELSCDRQIDENIQSFWLKRFNDNSS